MSFNPKITSLTLYHQPGCPFCQVTLGALDSIDTEVELRNIAGNSAYREELVKGGGKAQVPCLRIHSDGQSHWLYESQAIIQFLRRRAA